MVRADYLPVAVPGPDAGLMAVQAPEWSCAEHKGATMTKALKKNTAAISKESPKPVTQKATNRTSKVPSSESKQDMLIGLLQRPAGATIEDMTKVTGWQQHSVRGVLSGVLKKRLGLTVTSEPEERGRVYRIAGAVSRL